jgi:hypothetical protein
MSLGQGNWKSLCWMEEVWRCEMSKEEEAEDDYRVVIT